MKRIAVVAAVIALLSGCGGDNSADAKSKLYAKVKNAANEVKANQATDKKKFKQLYSHINHVNNQLPKLNSTLQKQLQLLQTNNASSLAQVKSSLDKNIASVHQDINNFGATIAKHQKKT